MTIEAVTVPTRSRLWSDEDAAQAYALLTADPPQAAKYATYPKPEDGSDEDGSKRESKARTQGMALDRLINANHGRRFGVSVWKDAEGAIVGALVPRAPVARKAKSNDGSGNAAKGGQSRRGRG